MGVPYLPQGAKMSGWLKRKGELWYSLTASQAARWMHNAVGLSEARARLKKRGIRVEGHPGTGAAILVRADRIEPIYEALSGRRSAGEISAYHNRGRETAADRD